MTIKSWEDYREFAFNNLGEFKNKDQDVLFLNLFESIGVMFGSFKKEILTGQNNKEELVPILGDILWACAVIERQYLLPASRASNSFNLAIKKEENVTMVLEILLLQGDFATAIVDLTDSALGEDYDSMQYCISRIMTGVLNIALYKDFSLREPLLASCNKIAKSIKTNNAVAPKTTRDHKKEFEEAKKEIKASKVKEVSIDLIKEVVDETDAIYRGLKVKNGRKTSKFETGDLILDFFNASNNIAKELPKQHYNLLYTVDFRAVLENLISTKKIISAYLYEDKLIEAADLKVSPTTTDVFADKTKYRPVLIRPEMKTLDHLLNYISDVKKIKTKKL